MRFIILLLIASLFPIVSATYSDAYVLSPDLAVGSYAEYKIYFHPKYEFVRWEILEIVDAATVKLRVTFTSMGRDRVETIQYVTVSEPKPIDSPSPYEVSFTQTLISFPDTYIIPFPILSPHLSKRDYLTLEERRFKGWTIARIGGEVWNYSFRRVYFAGDDEREWAWDVGSGVLIRYSDYALYNPPRTPIIVELVRTNVWGSPLQDFMNPMNLLLFVFGFYFTHWEAWAVSVSAVALLLVRGWLTNLVSDWRSLRSTPNLEALLREVNDQKKRVKTINV